MNDLFKVFEEIPEFIQAEGMELLVEDFIYGVQEGEEEAFVKMIQLKAVEKFLAEAKSKLSDLVLQELDIQNNREYSGFKVYKTTTPTKYKFDHFQKWKELETKVKEIKKDQKEVENQMKLAFLNGLNIVNEDTGEIVPPAKYGSGGSENFAIK